MQRDRLAAVRTLADDMTVSVVLNGHRTLVARPDGRVAVSSTGNAGMATAGTGDALTGAIGAWLAATDILSTRAGLELVRDFEGCSEEVRKTVYLLCKATAGDVRPVSRKKAK